MAKKKIRQVAQQLATETAAKPLAASARAPLQTPNPVTVSNSAQSGAPQVQKAAAKVVVAQGSLTTGAQSPSLAVLSRPVLLTQKVEIPAEAPVPSDLPKVKVTFVFPVCQCCPKRVSVSGDFNGWSPDATPMKRYEDGHWEKTLELPPGRYEYKFVRDGEWMPDLLATENVLNGYGTLNSVIEVRTS